MTPDAKLPNTGVPFEVERMLGSIFIQSERYGTRASTVLSVSGDGARLSEAGFAANGEPQERIEFQFPLLTTKRQPATADTQ